MRFRIPLFLAACLSIFSCRVFDEASRHGFQSGYYRMDTGKEGQADRVYVDVLDTAVCVYRNPAAGLQRPDLVFPLGITRLASPAPLVFRKQSLDIDISTILLKYRPNTEGMPAQLHTDMNVSLFAGWRHDRYRLVVNTDPLGRREAAWNSLGFDFGGFLGTGSTFVGPFTTANRTQAEYNGMILQAGLAGFIESDIASFGLAAGIDQLMNRDKAIWIYNRKPWIGFIVGIALN